MPEAYDQATRSIPPAARRSRRVLVLFSGPCNRPDGLASFLTQLGLEPVLVDSDPQQGGGEEHNRENKAAFFESRSRLHCARQ